MADEPRSVTWKATLIGGAMTIATSIGGYVSSHWGGVTSEQLQQAEQRITASVNKVEAKVASESTRLQAYVDEKVSSAEARAAAVRPKKKRSDAAQ